MVAKGDTKVTIPDANDPDAPVWARTPVTLTLQSFQFEFNKWKAAKGGEGPFMDLLRQYNITTAEDVVAFYKAQDRLLQQGRN